MICVICKQGATENGVSTVTLEHEDVTLVIKGVPARVCANCGERYVDERITASLLSAAQDAAQVGVQVDIREYVAA